MRLQVLLMTFIQVSLVESIEEVSGYVGEAVTLFSGADPSWNLSKVEWSIFSNTTWIATYRKGKKITERFYQYKGRLHLDISSGDLTIKNLNTRDAIEYSVDLISTKGHDSVKKTKLIVRERLQKPTIKKDVTTSEKGVRWVVLQCSSADQGVDLTWQVKPPSAAVLNTSHEDSAVLLAYLNATQNRIEYTCTSSRHTENASSVSTLKYDEEKPQPQTQSPLQPQPPSPSPTPQPRRQYYGAFSIGGALGASLTVIVIYFLREKLLPKKGSA